MIYNLSSFTDKDRFKRRCEKLLESDSMVELTEKKEHRTLPQNKYLHLILGWFALEVGHTIDYVKREYFKRLVNRELFVQEEDDKYAGRVETLRSSRDLDTAQMTNAIERFRNWASDTAGIYIPSPNEGDFLKDIEKELARNYHYL